MSEPTPSLLQQITDALKVAPRPFTHPQYIEGVLYLTLDQYQYFIEEYLHTPFDKKDGIDSMWFNADRRIGDISGIPVIIMEPDTHIDLPSGRTLFHSTLLKSFYVVDTQWLKDPTQAPYLSTRYTYTPPTEEPHAAPHNHSPM